MENGSGGNLGPEAQGGAGVELARMLGVIKRAVLNWKPAAVLLVIGLGIGVGVAVVKKPSYRSETIVIYRKGVKLGEEGGGVGNSLGTRLNEILMARSRLENVIEELDLYGDIKRKRGMIEAVEELRKDITFKPRSTDTFSISYKGGDPETVMRVTQRLAQSLIDENQRLRIEQSRVQREFLSAEKDRSDEILKEKERLLAVFMTDHPEFALDDKAGTGGAVLRQQKKESDKANSGASPKDALLRQRQRLEGAIKGDVPLPSAEAAADPELVAARDSAASRLASSKSDLAGKKSQFTDQHPDVQAAKQRVASDEIALKAAEDKVAQSRMANNANRPVLDPEEKKKKMQAELSKLDEKLSALDSSKKEKKTTASEEEEASGIVSLETDYARLSRDVGEARDQLTQLERTYFRAQIEASSSLGGYSDQVVVLDPAFKPTRPEAPGKSVIVAIAAVLALVIGMVVAFLRALLDDHVYEEGDLARVTPLLAVVPRGVPKRWWRK